MILFILLISVALFIVNGIVFPKTKGFIQTIKIPVQNKAFK